MTNQTTATEQMVNDGMPAALVRKPGDAPAAPKATKVAKAPRAAKPAKVAKAPKAAKSTHKPTTIVSTEANPGKSIVPVKFKALYAEHNDTNGDKIGLTLKAATETTNKDGRTVLDVDALKAIAAANGVDFAKYELLNNGQKRMNVGNKLRGLLKAGKKVVIGKQTFADAGKALAKPVAAEQAAEQAAA